MDYWLNKVHHGDALELLKQMPDNSVDLVLTDPPYPSMRGDLKVAFNSGVARRRNINKTVADPWGANLGWLPDAFRVCKYGLFCFCSFHSITKIPPFVPQKPVALVTWYKRNAMPSLVNAPPTFKLSLYGRSRKRRALIGKPSKPIMTSQIYSLDVWLRSALWTTVGRRYTDARNRCY